jgi:hypothetical protein
LWQANKNWRSIGLIPIFWNAYKTWQTCVMLVANQTCQILACINIGNAKGGT